MSTAALYTDSDLDRPVLIKQLQTGVEQRRIRDEVQALTAIRSKHVVQLYDVVSNRRGDITAIVLEYLPGGDLDSAIPAPDIGTFIRLAYSIATGIADIHNVGQVHRDIKPNNMKFDAEGTLKIFDFGLARDRNTGAATKGAVGTNGYMAPELCVDDDETANFTQAIDVYAFGATVLKLVRGTLPRDLRRFPPRLPCGDADFSAQRLPVPADISDMCGKCLSVSPTNRPTIHEVQEVLSAHLLIDRHRATLVTGSTVHVLDANRRSVALNSAGLGSLTIRYDGLRFIISAATGEVFVNNVAVKVPHALPGACVITLGGQELGWSRMHVTVDVSHPEVVL